MAAPSILSRHKDKDFVRRIFNSNQPFITNPDGSRSTHRMAAEIMTDGSWAVFPTIVSRAGRLQELPLAKAQQYAIETGEYIPFTDKREALAFAKGGYKRGTPMERRRTNMARRPLYDPLGIYDPPATLPRVSEIPLLNVGLPDLTTGRRRERKPPPKRRVKKRGDYITGAVKEIGDIRRLGMGREAPPRKSLAEVAAERPPAGVPQVDLGGRSRTGREIHGQPRASFAEQVAGVGAPAQTGIETAVQGLIERQTREPFAATVLSPAAHRLYLEQKASRLRWRRNVAASEPLADLREEALRKAWTERYERGGRPSTREPESAIVRGMAGGPQYAPETLSRAEREYQRQGNWLAEWRLGKQAVRNAFGDVDDAEAYWTSLVRRQNAGQPLSDSDINILAEVKARQRMAQSERKEY